MSFTKNLIFYAYLQNEDFIDKNFLTHLNLLKHYNNVFDGQIIIYLASDKSIKNKKRIIDLFSFFPNKEIEFVKNDSECRESAYFQEQIHRLKNQRSITFYCHNKGTTHDDTYQNCLNWIVAMYYFNLEEEFDPHIQLNMFYNIFAGCLRKDVSCAPWVCSDWHFSGTYFWFNTQRMLEMKLPAETSRWAAESICGKVAPISDSYCIANTNYDYNFDARTDEFWTEFFQTKMNTEQVKKFQRLKALSTSMSLTKITNYIGSDKGTEVGEKHSYTEVYESLFASRRLCPTKILEIGISDPRFPYASIKIWDSYFQNIEITGLDIADCSNLERNMPNFRFHQINQFEQTDHDRIVNLGQKYDIIIDDGPHVYDAQILSFNNFFKLLENNGLYIIEDLHCDDRIVAHLQNQGVQFSLYCNNKLLVVQSKS